MQVLYLLALDLISETIGDGNSYGFRPQWSTADAIQQCFNVLSRKNSPQWILEGDIKSCFDRISHDWLLANVPMDRTILRKWLQAGYLEKHVLYATEAGTPQGGIASPILANVARYADDFVITGASPELLEQEVKPLVARFLAERGLELSTEKSCITHIEAGFDFLGQNVRKYNGGKTMLITPSRKNVKTFLDVYRHDVAGHSRVVRAATCLVDRRIAERPLKSYPAA